MLSESLYEIYPAGLFGLVKAKGKAFSLPRRSCGHFRFQKRDGLRGRRGHAFASGHWRWSRVTFAKLFGFVASAVNPFPGQSLAVSQSPGSLASGASLGLQVCRHGGVVVLPNLKVVPVGSGNGSPPEATTHHFVWLMKNNLREGINTRTEQNLKRFWAEAFVL